MIPTDVASNVAVARMMCFASVASWLITNVVIRSGRLPRFLPGIPVMLSSSPTSAEIGSWIWTILPAVSHSCWEWAHVVSIASSSVGAPKWNSRIRSLKSAACRSCAKRDPFSRRSKSLR